MRVFFGIPLPSDVKQSIASVQQFLPKGVRAMREDTLHITLHFLGEHTQNYVTTILRRVNETTLPALGPLSYHGVGIFGTRIVWVGVSGTGLTELMSSLAHCCGGKTNTPHVTIGRNKTAKRTEMKKFVKMYEGKYFGKQVCHEITLFERVRGNETLYRPVGVIECG